jgi:4-hydroxyphenylpyruvate dioxygenase
MKKIMTNGYAIDYIEFYTPMAKTLAYWHKRAVGFQLIARADHETGQFGSASYVLVSGQITLVLTSANPWARLVHIMRLITL